MSGDDSDLRQQKTRALALIREQRLAEAHTVCRCICEREPAAPENWFMLATVAGQTGQLEEALDSYNQALRLQPAMPAAWFNKGMLCHSRGDLDQAEACYREVLRFDSDFAPACINLGNVLFIRGDVQEAESCYRRAVALQPDSVDALANLGKLLQSAGRFSHAESFFRRALAVQPQLADLHNELGMSLNGEARTAEAADAFRQAVALQPDFYTASSNLLLTLNYSEDLAPGQVFNEHRQWGRAAEARVTPYREHPGTPDPDRRLRIGYISPDFRDHSVACFFAPLLANHDAAVVETFCYSDVQQPDAVTRQLMGDADHWRATAGMSDMQAAERVRADCIDILVDLAGHTARNRLALFAARPAPLQVTWLGYPNTTGLSVMDYRLTDGWADPEGTTEQYHTESLLRLPGGFLCYRPLTVTPDPAVCPSPAAGHVTFGSFNSFVKMAPGVLQAWTSILQSVPGSRLLLKNFSLNDPEIRTRCLDTFRSLGIGSERLELHGTLLAKQDHLELYRRIDIALDTFPYNGTTTTCEALWMGVPVVTLAGDRHAGRVGVSLMHSLGLPQLVATRQDEYTSLAVALAFDIDQRQQWRTLLRTQMESSSLCNGAEFALSAEQAYRGMWMKWCAAA